MGDNSKHFPNNPKRGETVTILVNSSGDINASATGILAARGILEESRR